MGNLEFKYAYCFKYVILKICKQVLTLMCCRYKEMSRIKDLMSLSCSLNFFSASSKVSSLIWKPERSVREVSWHFSEDLSWNQWATCGENPVRCLRWLLTLLDFLIMECMLSLEIFSMNVSSSPFLYFTTMTAERVQLMHTQVDYSLRIYFFIYQGLFCVCTRWCLRWSLWRPAEPWSAGASRDDSLVWLPEAPSTEEGNASLSERAWLRTSQGWCSLFFPWEKDRERPQIRASVN